ncbi:N-fatty-acyl-amino acid synthase/hydrolase PM20D1 [Lepeophtheirus salmonis]|uniref:N-fatty-acyl-amino acid synthase/hydrolase PM20D1 n=1 Tax=Lepeophtheirus salmonis TaxID=72036 RepID=UPI001AE32856|nr:N-fatty-acyl-amino acid synthase/hydrolase PM20D1-like [Lepeophtheirus salmonis]XP_040583302.1 N-fatty-acyl-amino acid synthase/hydrolase PM20D1-like [Lepeophtheirus salmonis]XP_040583303.1 N-fatty-acyl-amino acid synthase/hydrolase PM20D1-like [Lepeophtheirus salmonis]
MPKSITHNGYILPSSNANGKRYQTSKESKRCCNRRSILCCSSVFCIPILILVGLLLALVFNAFMIVDPFELNTSIIQETGGLPSYVQPSNDVRYDRAKRLSEALKYKTVSYGENDSETGEILEFHSFLQKSFPLLYDSPHVTVERVHTYSLLYRIEGKDPIGIKYPYLLCGHLDVVPEGKNSWSHPPFEGYIGPGSELDDEGDEDYVWGRGALDNKNAVMGIMEALNLALAEGNRPKRTVYIAFGHDEEVGGRRGAKYISKRLEELLESNGESLHFILDEGTLILDKFFSAIESPFAYISVMEKGMLDLELKVEGNQTHSSFPPYETPIGILSEAMSNLEYNEQPARFGNGIEEEMVNYLRPHSSFVGKLILGNLWLFRPLISYIASLNPTTDALQRTTTALTKFDAGVKNNVIPGVAKAIVNHRIYQGEDLETVLQRDIDTISNERVTINVLHHVDPSPVSEYGNDHVPFQILANAVKSVYPETLITPGPMVGATDSRHYLDLTNSIYRFSPFIVTSKEFTRIHGIDENLS